jgi:hypothetical protein
MSVRVTAGVERFAWVTSKPCGALQSLRRLTAAPCHDVVTSRGKHCDSTGGAPEQLMGDELDGRADEYVLAATAYHLLTESQLLPHSNAAVVISRHLNTPPPALADTRPELAALDLVLEVALAKDPQDRFAR